jgi:hypothetical protein
MEAISLFETLVSIYKVHFVTIHYTIIHIFTVWKQEISLLYSVPQYLRDQANTLKKEGRRKQKKQKYLKTQIAQTFLSLMTVYKETNKYEGTLFLIIIRCEFCLKFAHS